MLLADMADMYLGRREQMEEEAGGRERSAGERHSSDAESVSRGLRELRTAHPHDIEDCENLLENFFMQVSCKCPSRKRLQPSICL